MRYMASMIDLERIFGKNPADFDISDLNSTFDIVTNLMFGLSGSVALIFLIWGGILYLTAGGSADQAGRAKATITWAIAGLVVVIAAYAIVNYFAGIVVKDNPF